MSDARAIQSAQQERGIAEDPASRVRMGFVALALAAAYFVGAKIGLALTAQPQPVSTLWPPNAILLGALLLAPVRSWAMLIVAVLPAHLAVELGGGVPFAMVMSWFVSNCSEALIGAIAIRFFVDRKLQFDTVRDVGIFVIFGALLAPFLSSFLDAAFVQWNHWGAGTYWEVWRVRFFSNVLAILTLVPAIVVWGHRGVLSVLRTPPRRAIEATFLAVTLVVTGTLVFAHPPSTSYAAPAMLFLPLPFLMWAAVRFGPSGASTCLLAFTVLAVWGAIHNEGPFVGHSVAQNVLSVQFFLIMTFIPLLALAAAIKERSAAEELARRNEERLNFTLNAAHVGAWDWNTVDSAILSQKSREIFGLGSHDPVVARELFYSMIVAEDREHVRAAADLARSGGGSYEIEYRIVRTDGAVRWISSKGTVMRDDAGRPMRMVGVHADITERKLVEQSLRDEAALRESEARLRELADAMPQIVFTAKADGRIDYFNKKWYEFTAAEPDAITDETWLDVMHPDDRERCLGAWRASVSEGRPHEHEGRYCSAGTGHYHWHLTRALPVRDETGAILRWYGTATDIDLHKQAEDALRGSERQLRLFGEQLEQRVATRTAELSRTNEALRSSEERFSKAFRASPDAITIARQPEGRIIEINERWESMFRYTRAEAIGRTFDSLRIYANEADHEKFRELMSLQGYVRELELDVRNSKGEIMRAVLAAETVDVGGEACVIIIMRDITERRRAEHEIVAQRRQLAHLGRIAVLGELSAALAHELNQPLTAILANARAAQRMLSRERVDRVELRAILDDIAADDLRAGAVIHRVRALLRKGDAEPQQVVANEVVTEVLELAHSDMIQRGVSVVTRLAPQLPPTPADRVQLQQVVLNLIVNASEAMTDNPASDRTMVVSTALEGEAVRLSVADRGPGISGNSMDSVFEPFFTSKENGLGLGLSICRSIVNAHGGRMWAVNNKDRGATFHVLLPLSSAGALKQQTPASMAAIPTVDRR